MHHLASMLASHDIDSGNDIGAGGDEKLRSRSDSARGMHTGAYSYDKDVRVLIFCCLSYPP
jgi:hypothetical protein